MQEPARLILMYLVFPLWVAAGLVDWACHRRTQIELTSGLKENLMHWLLFAEIGAGMLAVVFLELNAAVLAIVAAVFLLHELTVYWDLHYTTPIRRVGPFEQMVHSFLELLPLLSLALLASMAWPQAQAMVGMGDAPADWSLQAKRDGLPGSYLIGAFVLASVCNGVPLLEETWRCWRVRARIPARPAPR